MPRSLRITYVLLLLVSSMGLLSQAYAQPLTGIKTIPGTYATLAAAIADLNLKGVGSGGVTFNITAGYSETFLNDSAGTIKATGTASNPIIFKKSGAGTSPVIFSYQWTTSTNYDGIIKIAGGDYITIDGLYLTENGGNSTIFTDWGIALVKANATSPYDGCQHVTIKNCTINLTRTNQNSVGIYSGNHTATSINQLSIADSNDANSYNKFDGNLVENCNTGISLSGYAAPSPYSLYDRGNEIGTTSGNTINNFGGFSSSRGIFTIYQDNIQIAKNTISAIIGPASTTFGIFLSGPITSVTTGTTADIYDNTISLRLETGTSNSLYGIAYQYGGNVNIYGNLLENCNYTTASTGHMLMISFLNNAANVNVNIHNNIIRNNTLPGTGNFYAINPGSATTAVNIYNNLIYGNSKTGTSGNIYITQTCSVAVFNSYNNEIHDNTMLGGNMYCLTGATGNVSVHDNIINNNTMTPGTSSGTLYGYYNNGNGTGESIANNTITNLTIAGTNAGAQAIWGINSTSPSVIKEVFGNTVSYFNITTTGGGTIYGINGAGSQSKIHSNKIFGLNAGGSAGTVYGIYIPFGSNSIYNNMISFLNTPSGSGNIAVAGIYISGGSYSELCYNTIYLNASSTSNTFGSAGVFGSIMVGVALKNNIIHNASTPGNGNYGAKTVAFRRNGIEDYFSYSPASNNNMFNAGTPDSSRVIYFNGGYTLADQTIEAYKLRVAPVDELSFTESPPYINAPSDLHINTTIPTQLEKGAARLMYPEITLDYDSQLRDTVSPDVGADEFNGTYLDLRPPVISYQYLQNTTSTTYRTLVATITDYSGVPTGAPGWPYLYWRKNSGTWTGVAPTTQSGNEFTFFFGGGVALGDIVQYYVAAQDVAVPPNVGVHPYGGAGGFTANPPAVSTPPTNPGYYTIVPVPANPTGVSAVANSPNDISVSFTTNPNNNNVLIVWNLTGVFTTPSGSPPGVGEPFAGGTVLYNFIFSPVNHTGLTQNTTYYYKLFSFDYAYNYSPGVTAQATTIATGFQLSVDVMNGWNMVSVPGMHPTNQNVDTWWVNRNQLASVYKWTGSYTAVTSAAPKEGYWMLHNGAQTYNTGDEWPSAIQSVTHDPIPLTSGWNMIGAYESNVPVSGLTTSPPGIIVAGTIYGWNGAYYTPTNLVPGYAYWVMTNGAGVINLTKSVSGKLAKTDNSDKWNKITLSDAAGKSFTLYAADEVANLENYQLPPLPPAGCFDVRFTSQRKAENLTTPKSIDLRGVQYPVTLTSSIELRVQDETGKLLNKKIKAGESLTINSGLNKLIVSESKVPDVFSLEQNYPNPFNPVTMIKFTLPEDVKNVTLAIYDALGQKIAELVNGSMEAGYYQYQWDASKYASGFYICHFRADNFVSTKKMLLMK